MVFRKYKPAKQWGKMDTRIFKEMLNARNNRKMPYFQIPEAVKALGVQIHDPNTPGFFTGDVYKQEAKVNHPAFRAASVEDHPLYNTIRCFLFDGSEAMSDGLDQACNLSRAILRNGFPESIVHSHQHLDVTERMVKDAILHGEKYDPTLEKLPVVFDPILFWHRHIRMHGTPIIKRNNIILSNLYRAVILTGLSSRKVQGHLRCDKNEPLSACLSTAPYFSEQPFVLRFQPHLTIQAEKALSPWADTEEVSAISSLHIPDIKPISPLIDLGSDNVYNTQALVPRLEHGLALDTIMWAREQDQKYPWTSEQNAANAVLHTFGAAVAEATRRSSSDLQKDPVVVKGVQIVNGKLDLVAFQLNTLDFTNTNPVKNIVWLERGLPLYKPKPYHEQLDDVDGVNMDTVHKFVSLVLTR